MHEEEHIKGDRKIAFDNLLTHLSLASHKGDTDKQCRPRSDAPECGVWSGATLFALNSEISMKYDNNKNQPDIPYKGNGPVQRVRVEESTRHKWVNAQHTG